MSDSDKRKIRHPQNYSSLPKQGEAGERAQWASSAINTDNFPRCSFVPNGTNLSPLQISDYCRRYAKKYCIYL